MVGHDRYVERGDNTTFSITYRYGTHHEKINKLKLRVGCQVCGYKEKASALLFFSLEPFRYFPTTTARGWGWSTMYTHLLRKVVVCANCCRIVQYGEYDGDGILMEIRWLILDGMVPLDNSDIIDILEDLPEGPDTEIASRRPYTRIVTLRQRYRGPQNPLAGILGEPDQ